MRKRLTVLLPLLVIASGAIWSVAPQGAAQQTLNCGLSLQQPEHPLEMNTVVSDPRTSQFRDPLFKHVVMEKEIYECIENEGTDQERRFTRDIETFIEIIQRAQGGRTTTVEKRVEEIVCDMANGGPWGVQCSARDVPLEQVPPDVLACFPNQRGGQEPPRPLDPVEMNTAITSRQDTIKTIKVDKSFLGCTLPGDNFARAHLYVFTEIVEGRIGGPADTIRPTEKKFQAILCLLDDFNARIARCNHFIPAGVNG